MIDILMPRLSDTMAEGSINAWRKRPGDPVAPGDVLVEIETDKAMMEQEAYEAGVLAEILVPEGGTAAIGTPIARLDNGASAGETSTVAAAEPPAAAQPRPQLTSVPPSPVQPSPARPAAPPEPQRPAVPPAAEHRLAASPLVRKLARERGIDLATVPGTGPGGRIIRADLDAHQPPEPSGAGGPTGATGQNAATRATEPSGPAETVPTGADARDPHPVPFDTIRQAIATRLAESAATPTFTATASADVKDLRKLRAGINESGTRVTVNDLLVRAVALALRAHPGMNASYSPDGRGQTLLHQRIHLGIAVAAPAGLVVPVVHDADRLAVTAISAITRDLGRRAADRTLTTADLSDGTFTISNLGSYGVEHFTAIINPPQGAILAVGAARKRLRYTVTADHRIIDGALAAQFLATLTDLLEHPLRLVT
ncbi:dihydrolipoamide acetyltransferase family protein [Amycolatopsis jejuensis]|uniref:dihydrolipoamide acetyltransferase family protein n=1 Tax=Amycolatopsis jejuensis TaxID=330084 RepID=UPI0006915FC6|nr:dihydrolipoamide acetyltransferase family protein [Amycolatopsis jejuensis]